MEPFDLLKRFTEAPGPSGDERGIAAAIEEVWRPLVDSITFDRVGNLVARKEGTADSPRPTLLLAAHQDELGLMVTQLVEHGGNGFLRVTGVGGVDRRHLLGQTVVVRGAQPLVGVIGGLPDSYLPENERGKALGWEGMVVDVGLTFDRLRELVSVGDFITFRQPARRLMGGRATGKALDNRASVTAVTICLEQLQGRRHVWDVLAVATSQEEESFLGGYTSGHAYRPEAAVAIDVCHAKGPGTSDNGLAELGGGPVLGIGANVHPGLYGALRDAAKALEMTVTVETHTAGSGTDAYPLQVAREGIPTGLVSIPLRYMHTMVETADLSDVERVGRLLAEMIARLDDKFLDNIKEELMRPEEA